MDNRKLILERDGEDARVSHADPRTPPQERKDGRKSSDEKHAGTYVLEETALTKAKTIEELAELATRVGEDHKTEGAEE
jgi:hypothetical protein